MEKKKKVKMYEEIIEEVKGSVCELKDRKKLLGETVALLKEKLVYSTRVGFYFVRGRELHLGPYQGPPPCERIPISQGICGKAAEEEETMVVPDIKVFPRHIAGDQRTRSEIVVPVFDREGHLFSVLNLDSTEKGAFDRTDRRYLEELANILREKI